MREQTKKITIIVCLVALLLFQLTPFTVYAASDYDFALKDEWPYYTVCEDSGGYAVFHLSYNDLGKGGSALIMKFHTLEDALYYLETGDDSKSWGNNQTNLYSFYFNSKTPLYGNVLQCENPPPYARDDGYEYKFSYPLQTWMVIQIADEDGKPLTIQVPAATFALNENFKNFVVVQRFADEYGMNVFSLVYSDSEIYYDQSENGVTTHYLDKETAEGGENLWENFCDAFHFLFDDADVMTAFIETLKFKLGNRKAEGMLMTIDFENLDDAMHVLQHTSTYDATHMLEEFGIDAYGHIEPCLGGNIITNGTLKISAVYAVSHYNAADGKGLYNEKGELIIESTNFFKTDENGNIMYDENGNPIQVVIGAEDLEPEYVYGREGLEAAFNRAKEAFLGIVRYMEFLPADLHVQIRSYLATAFAVAAVFLAAKVLGTIT